VSGPREPAAPGLSSGSAPGSSGKAGRTGWWILAFFLVLGGLNAAFYWVAAGHPPEPSRTRARPASPGPGPDAERAEIPSAHPR
jgi:hypothetical protein